MISPLSKLLWIDFERMSSFCLFVNESKRLILSTHVVPFLLQFSQVQLQPVSSSMGFTCPLIFLNFYRISKPRMTKIINEKTECTCILSEF